MIISNANIQILENGSLSIREVSREDAGPYMCQAVNGVGPGISKVINLDVHGKRLKTGCSPDVPMGPLCLIS